MKRIINKICSQKMGNIYLIVFLIFGILLMLIPTNSSLVEAETAALQNEFSVEEEENRLKHTISSIRGVGGCEVLLSICKNTEINLDENEDKKYILGMDSGENGVVESCGAPYFQGAIVVIGGYENASTRFDVLSAVMSYTGLEIDKITICPLEE